MADRHVALAHRYVAVTDGNSVWCDRQTDSQPEVATGRGVDLRGQRDRWL